MGEVVIVTLLIGFPLALFFAWAFELTLEGVKREKDVNHDNSVTAQTGKRLDGIIIIGLDASLQKDPTSINKIWGTDSPQVRAGLYPVTQYTSRARRRVVSSPGPLETVMA